MKQKYIHPEKYREFGLTVGLCSCVQENKGVPDKHCECCYGTGVSVYTHVDIPSPSNCPHWAKDDIYVKGFRCALYRDTRSLIHPVAQIPYRIERDGFHFVLPNAPEQIIRLDEHDKEIRADERQKENKKVLDDLTALASVEYTRLKQKLDEGYEDDGDYHIKKFLTKTLIEKWIGSLRLAQIPKHNKPLVDNNIVVLNSNVNYNFAGCGAIFDDEISITYKDNHVFEILFDPKKISVVLSADSVAIKDRESTRLAHQNPPKHPSCFGKNCHTVSDPSLCETCKSLEECKKEYYGDNEENRK